LENRVIMRKRGFTLIELLVVIAVIALLMGILLPSLRMAQEQGRRVVCLSNLKQLLLAWIMYADANEDKIIYGAGGVFDTSGETPWVGDCVAPGYVSGSLLPTATQIAEIKKGALWSYVKNIDVYKCPTGYRGAMITYSIVDSMNGWETGRTPKAIARMIKIRTQIKRPEERIVFVDEGFMTPDSYAVYFDTPKDTWWDAPMMRHSGGTNYGFADGHSEHRKWRGSDTLEIARRQDKQHTNNEKPWTDDGKRDLYMVQISTWGELGYTPTLED
jgi:prepilin-type N-terminal cleavage/methylation domain-containing protein/prepilin-type processing-associated H-X9-DG protein